MGRIPEEDVERVRDATDIVSLVSETVQLKQKGRLMWGCCPFHAEKTPSFKVDPASGLWHCFGCGTGGDAIGFVMKAENLDFPDAVRRLAARAHVEIHEESGGMPSGLRERLLAASAEAADFFHDTLTRSRDQGAAQAREYLKARGIGSDTAKAFDLGFAPASGSPLTAQLLSKGFARDEVVQAGLATESERGQLKDRFFARVIFPIHDLSGRTIAFGGRVIGEGRPKYLNSAETPLFHKSANLYAIDRAKNEIVRHGAAIVVEGYTDVIALHVAGLPNTVATLGTALTEQHVRLLAKFAKRIVYLFDGDDAGMRAARRAEEFLDWQSRPEFEDRSGKAAGRADLRVALIPEGKDPADYVAAYGGERLAALVDEAAPLLRFLIEQRLGAHDLSSPEGRSTAMHEVARDLIAPLKDSLLAHDYTNFLADRLQVDYGTVQQAVLAATKAGAATKRSSAAAPAQQVPARTGMVTDPERLAEEQLLAIVARTPSLRAQAADVLTWGMTADAGRRALLEAVLASGDAVGQQLFAAIADAAPELAEAASAVLLSESDPAGDTENFALLCARLKEFSLRRQINGLQARLGALDPVKDRAEYDDVFRHIAQLRDRRPQELKVPGAKAHGQEA